MKKFSKLISESGPTKNQMEGLKMHPTGNPVDWEEIFDPLIRFITDDLKSNNKGPGQSLFSNETLSDLKRLIHNVNQDYKVYWKDVIDDGSQESFLNAFKIKTKHESIFDCIQSMLDNTDDIGDYGDYDSGCFVVNLRSLQYNNLSESIQDLKESHSKLQMMDCDFSIRVETSSSNFIIDKGDDINELIDIQLGPNSTIEMITILIYNKITLQVHINDDSVSKIILNE